MAMSIDKKQNDNSTDISIEDEITKYESLLNGMTSDVLEEMKYKLTLLKMSGSSPDLEKEYEKIIHELE